jgi:hypothetical protein
MEDDNLFKKVLYLVAIVLAIKFVILGGAFKSDKHSGRGYTIKFPSGWTQNKDVSTNNSILASSETPEVIMYSTPELNEKRMKPAAQMGITTFKLSQATWAEDEFPYILGMLIQSGMTIKDKGQIKIDDRVNYWVLYFDKTNMLHWEFYYIDDSNIFFKLEYICFPESFSKYRPDFEAAKDTLKYSGFTMN